MSPRNYLGLSRRASGAAKRKRRRLNLGRRPWDKPAIEGQIKSWGLWPLCVHCGRKNHPVGLQNRGGRCKYCAKIALAR
jgi:hypothetical protein